MSKINMYKQEYANKKKKMINLDYSEFIMTKNRDKTIISYSYEFLRISTFSQSSNDYYFRLIKNVCTKRWKKCSCFYCLLDRKNVYNICDENKNHNFDTIHYVSQYVW